MSTNPTSTNVRIGQQNFGQSIIYATFDGVEEEVVRYYADEIHFSTEELEGKTRQQIDDIWMAKDTAYLRS
jgi:hypothetical protein